MMKLVNGFLCLVVLSLTGCPPSIFPFYTEETLRFEEGLLGGWEAIEDDDGEYYFTRGENQAYELKSVDNGEASYFVAHLVDIGKYRYLNVTASPLIAEGVIEEAFVPVHWIYRIDIEGDRFTLMLTNYAWIMEGLKDGSMDLAHVFRDDDSPLLTATPKELQAFLIRHQDNPELFLDDEDEIAVLRRKTE